MEKVNIFIRACLIPMFFQDIFAFKLIKFILALLNRAQGFRVALDLFVKTFLFTTSSVFVAQI